MKCLIDADVLLHELGWSGQFKDKETGEQVLLPFEEVQELLDKKIKLIELECDATQKSTLFISSSEKIVEMWNKNGEYYGRKPLVHEPNFRYAVAKTKPYKGQRKNPKPFHFYNILAYMMSEYDVVISENGLEADDEICIAQRIALDEGQDTTICSRDKDLRICPGWHYSWECGKQSSMGPEETSVDGFLRKKPNGDIYGFGLMFFLYQCLIGDSADNIPGLPGVGPARAWAELTTTGSRQEAIKKVKDLYKEKLGEKSKEYFEEQACLLWMIQRRGRPFNLKELK